MSDRAIARELGVGNKTVGRWLADAPPGHGPDGKFKARAEVDPADVTRLREQTVTRERKPSWREIGAELGVSHETARRLYGQREDAPGVAGKAGKS